MSIKVRDLSNNNARVDVHTMRGDGVAVVVHKVTESTNFVDRFWAARAASFRQAGIHVGGYHFAHPIVGDAARQANFFCDHLGPIGEHDARPWLDLEISNGLTPAEIVTFARTFNQHVVARTHVGPMLYSSRGFLEWLFQGLPHEEPIGYGLVVADFGPDDGFEHPFGIPHPWKHARAHQYTSKGHQAGVSGFCDLDSAPALAPLLAHPPSGRL